MKNGKGSSSNPTRDKLKVVSFNILDNIFDTPFNYILQLSATTGYIIAILIILYINVEYVPGIFKFWSFWDICKNDISMFITNSTQIKEGNKKL